MIDPRTVQTKAAKLFAEQYAHANVSYDEILARMGQIRTTGHRGATGRALCLAAEPRVCSEFLTTLSAAAILFAVTVHFAAVFPMLMWLSQAN